MKTYFIVAQADTDSEGYLKNYRYALLITKLLNYFQFVTMLAKFLIILLVMRRLLGGLAAVIGLCGCCAAVIRQLRCVFFCSEI